MILKRPIKFLFFSKSLFIHSYNSFNLNVCFNSFIRRLSTFDKDFSTVVQNVSEVKLNTKKKYENKFPKERIDSETNYAKEIMHAALMSKNQDLYAGIGDPNRLVSSIYLFDFIQIFSNSYFFLCSSCFCGFSVFLS